MAASVENSTADIDEDVTKIHNEERIDLDTIMEEIGEFGSFQVRLMGICAVVSILASWTFSEYLFTTARINTRCLIPECDSPNPDFHSPWVVNAIPGSSDSLDNCQRYGFNSSLNSTSAYDACPADFFDQTVLEECQEYIYENTNTIAYDFDLACDEWRRTLIGSCRTIGMLLALPITGYISDRWGRRVAIALNAVTSACLGVMRYWADTYTVFIVSGVLETILGSSTYTSFYILLIESMGAKYRTVAAACMISFWATGMMALGLIAWAVPNWRNLTLTLYIPQFVSITYFWVVTESARWYLSKGKYKESQEILQKIAKTNRKTMSPNLLSALRRLAKEEKRKQDLKKYKTEPWLAVSVFKHKKVLLRCTVAPVWWITTTFIYYGLSINAVNMVGNSFLNFVAVSAVEIPGFWTAVLLIDRIGRKPVLIAAFWICAGCQVAYIFIPSNYDTLLLSIYLLGKYCIAVVFKSLYIYTAELYPTKHRNTMFSFTSMVGRIGSIIAPLTPAFGAALFDSFPFVLFGSCALISGVLMFLTPETLGTKLPDTMEDAEHLYNEENNTFILHNTTISKSSHSMEII